MSKSRAVSLGFVAALLAAAILGGVMSGGASAISRASTITPAPAFTAAQLTATPGADWLTAGGDLTSQRYSSLNQITAANVSGLKQAWKTNLDGSGKAAKYSQEATPIVHNGVIYIPTGNNDIFALDATTGAHLWKYESKIAQNNNTICCGWDARGLGFGEGKLFSEQLDGWLVAIDNTTGKQVWRTRNVRWQEGLTMTGAPVYYKGLVFVGMSGGEFGARGQHVGIQRLRRTAGVALLHLPAAGRHRRRDLVRHEWMTCGATVWSYPAIDTDDRHDVLHDVERRPVDGPRPGPEPVLVLDGRAGHEDRACTGGTTRWSTMTSGTTTARRRR